MTESLSYILRQLRSGLEDILGDQLEGVFLYGSQARGDAQPGSDIDVLIVLSGDFDYFNTLDATSELSWKLSLENDVVISKVFVSREKYDLADSPFLMNVHREAIPV